MYFCNKIKVLRKIYNIVIKVAQIVLKCIAPFNTKIKKGVTGRQDTFTILRKNVKQTDKTFWFHCASLGEYEQGLPVFQALRTRYKSYKIVLSFFSPSGYEIRENSPIADVVVYLPLDTINNAKQFINIVNPELSVFVKYDIWPNILNELKTRKRRAILISAAFRKEQPFFKFYGKLLRESLFAFEHIFTQNESSEQLLHSINYKNTSTTGDTRFDRVYNQLSINNTLDFIDTFKQNKLCLIAGSTWPEDEILLAKYINSTANKTVKYIIAPHNINENLIASLQNNLNVKSVLYTEKDNLEKLQTARVLIVNTIGLLSKAYKYADIAYIGGAVGSTGLHNTLEPAVFAVPIIIGDKYDKFPEAKAMIQYGGMCSISNQKEMNSTINELLEHEEKRLKQGALNLEFVKKHKGAVTQIIDYLRI